MKRISKCAVLVTIGVAAGCWEQPLEERLVVEVRADGGFGIRVETKLNAPGARDQHPAASQRVEQRAREILEGRDSWSYPFSRLEAVEEKLTWEKSLGDVRRAEHWAVVQDPQELLPVLRECGASLRVSSFEDHGRLEIFPLSRARATDKDRRSVENELKPWTEALVKYGQSVTKLFQHTKRHPDRALAVFGNVFADQLSEERRAALPDVTREEEELLEAFKSDSGHVLGFGSLEGEQSETLNERVMAAFSPLCGEIAVELPSPATDQAGFIERNGVPTIPPIDLYSALMAGGLTPVTPDPLLTLLERSRYRPSTDFELEAWLAQPRVEHGLLSASDGLRELKNRLAPAAVYRLEWTLPASDALESNTTEAPE